jgi:hypothetical protein
MRLPGRYVGRHAGPRAERRALPSVRGGGSPRVGRPMRAHLVRGTVRTLLRTLVAGVVLVGLANLAPPAAEIPSGPYATGSPDPAQLDLMRRFDCSPDGFGDGSTPRSAIIRAEGGHLRVVSFDRGWRVYTGSRPHALVAVCLDPPA